MAMKVILKQAVPKLGKEGQVVNVKPGYARNFLFPQGMAVVADKKQLQVVERRNAKVAASQAEGLAAAEALKAKIHGKEVSIQTKAGSDRRLFGAVTDQDVADAIKAQLGESIDKKAVLLLRPIKRLGRYDVELNVHRSVTMEVKVRVFDPEFVEFDEEMVVADESVVEPASEPAPIAEADPVEA